MDWRQNNAGTSDQRSDQTDQMGVRTMPINVAIIWYQNNVMGELEGMADDISHPSLDTRLHLCDNNPPNPTNKTTNFKSQSLHLYERIPMTPEAKLSWKVREWAEEADISVNYVYELAKSGKLKAVQVGSAWRILISPKNFYAQLVEEQAKFTKETVLDLDDIN